MTPTRRSGTHRQHTGGRSRPTAPRTAFDPVTATPSRGEGEVLTLTVGAPAHGGHCVARPVDDPTGRVVFVRHALPGETVRARLTARNAKIWRAEAVEVLTASPDRVRQVWPEAGPGGVGGGELGHVALPAQRTWKRWVLTDCLRRIGGEAVADAVAALGPLSVEAMPSEAQAQADGARRPGVGTRTRVELTVTPDGAAGMHAFRSSTVLAVQALPLAVPAIRELALTEATRWRRHYRPGMHVAAVAPSVGEPVVLLDGAVHTAAGRPTGRQRVEEVVDASGLGLGDLHYSVHADGFWQVHRDAPTVLVDRVVRDALDGLDTDPRPRVLELYAGAGLFTLPLAHLAGQVSALEGSAQAVRDSRRNLHHHANARLVAGRVTPATVAELGEGCDVVVLDPPRSGARRQVVQAVVGLAPRRVVLVACDPAALARDLGIFLTGGYAPTSVRSLDMFPHTHHMETVAVLEPAGA